VKESFSRIVAYGQHSIRYRLSFAERNTLQIKVEPDLQVHALAPRGAAPEAVDERIRSRASWILRQQREIGTYHPLPQARRYISGETHYFLGRQHRLRLVNGRTGVQPQWPFLVVSTPTPDQPSNIQEVLNSWYQAQAREVFPKRLAECMRTHRTLVHSVPRLQIRQMTRRWGSCSAAGTITLNVDLVKAPVTCIDYVIIHELCHLREPRHGSAFFGLLSRQLPDWKRRRQQLNQALQ
jgi:predicted metal-dependent hydrolase